jgi:hypothetical protein
MSTGAKKRIMKVTHVNCVSVLEGANHIPGVWRVSEGHAARHEDQLRRAEYD